jgi:hypothetical protein
LKNKFQFLLLFLIIGLNLCGQSKEETSNSTWIDFIQHIEKSNGVRIYYDPTEAITKETFVLAEPNTEIEEFKLLMETKGFAIIQYTEQQWVIVKIEDSKISQKDWEKRRNLEALAARAELEQIKIIGDEKPPGLKTEAEVNGTIIEQNNSNPIVGATIKMGESGTVTSLDGSYTLTVSPGEYNISVNSIGFVPYNEKVLVKGNGIYDVTLFGDAVQLEEVVISGKADNYNISSVEMGVEELTVKEIQKLPSFMGELDVIKSLLSLPGVSTAGDGIGGINVRGGTTDQNLIIQDGITFFNPSHALGFFNLFHPDLVEDIRLYKGNIPPKYGGRISSVLYTSSKNGNKQNWTGKAGIGLASSKLSFDGPIIKDKLSMTFGARISSINWLLNLIELPDVNSSKVNFYDLQGKLNYWINSTSDIGLQFYTASDDFQLADELQFDYKTKAWSAFYNTLIGENKSINARIVSGSYNSNLNDLLPTNSTRFNTGVDYLSGKIDLTIEHANSYLNAGFEAIHYTLQPGSVFPGDENSDVEVEIVDDELGMEMGIYANAELSLSNKLKLLSGIRFSGFGLLGPKAIRNYGTDQYFDSDDLVSSEFIESGWVKKYFGWEPRLAINLNFTENSSLKIGYNRTYQYLSQISNSVAATPIDFWKLSDNNIKPQSAHTASMGIYKNFNENLWQTSIEVYYRLIDNSLAFKDFADLIANDEIETELLLGNGRHYGVELSLEKKLGNVTGKVGYSYSRSLLQMQFDESTLSINNGSWYPSNYDKPHSLNFLLNFNASQRVNFNVNFSYSSGRPISGPVGKFDDRNVLGVPIFDEVNNFRIPDFHRLDLSMNIFPGYRKNKRIKGSWNISVYNIYGRKNAYSAFFRQQSISNLRAYKLAVLGTVFPSISYNMILN